MQPNIPLPTDNIYKFSCLFGLLLAVAGVFAFFSSYSAALEAKKQYVAEIIVLSGKVVPTQSEKDLLANYMHILEVTNKNEKTADVAITVLLVVAICATAWGATNWYSIVQARDDRMADLLLRKLQAEVDQLERAGKAVRRPAVTRRSVRDR